MIFANLLFFFLQEEEALSPTIITIIVKADLAQVHVVTLLRLWFGVQDSLPFLTSLGFEPPRSDPSFPFLDAQTQINRYHSTLEQPSLTVHHVSPSHDSTFHLFQQQFLGSKSWFSAGHRPLTRPLNLQVVWWVWGGGRVRQRRW